MDIIETILKLPESERQKINDVLALLRTVGANAPSNDSSGKSCSDLKESLNLSKNTPEKSLAKQKTLDNWIVKNKTSPSNSKKEVTNSEEILPILETEETSRNFDSEEVSSTLQDHQLPCSSSTSKEESSKSENVTDINKKKLMVLLNRQDCLESKDKSPKLSESSFEKQSISSMEINSPSKKPVHISENFDKKPLSSEKHSPTPPRSYNLRSARGISDEKPSYESSNSLGISLESEDKDKTHRSITKQKPKCKNSVSKGVTPNSIVCSKEVNDNQKNVFFHEIMSRENTMSSECEIPSLVVNSELENTSKAVSVNDNKITIFDESSIPVELGTPVVGKGKRKKTSKGKVSKKLCISNSAQKSSSEEIKSAQSVSSEKVTKLNDMNENPFELLIEKTILLPETDESISSNQNQSINSVVKLKPKQTTKKKNKTDLILQENSKLDSTATRIKKKKISNPVTDSSISENVGFLNKISDKQLKSTTTSESQSKEHVKEMENVSLKDANSVIPVNVGLKKVNRKRGCGNKSMKTDKNNLSSDSEMASKINDEDNLSEDFTETSYKISSSQIMACAKESEELLSKNMNSGSSVNVDSDKISRKRGSENKNRKAPKKSLLDDSELASKNNEQDRIASLNISPSQSHAFSKKDKEFLKDTNVDIPINVSSKKKIKKCEDKSMVAAKNSLSYDSGHVSKNDEKSITSEILPIDSSKNSPSQNKESSTKTGELLIKNTNTVTSVNVGSNRKSRNRGIGNKCLQTNKNSLSDSEQAFKNSDKDRIASIETLSKISPSQNSEFPEESVEVIKNINTIIPKKVSPKKKLRKGNSEDKSMVEGKNSLSNDSEQTSKNDENYISSSDFLSIDSSKSSPPQSKKCSKAEELLIKDTNAVNSVSVDSKRTSRKKGIKNKCLVTTKKNLISDSDQASKNSDKNSITFIETALIDSSANSPSVLKKLSAEEISSMNNSSTSEKITLSLNHDKCSQSAILQSQPGDKCRKNSLNSSNNELDFLNEMKESPEDQSQKSNAVSPNDHKSSDNVLPLQENSSLSGISKKVNTLKKKVSVPANPRKKLKVTKEESQSITSQSISDNLGNEMVNPVLNFKKSGSEKKIASLKLKVLTDSSKRHSDASITKSKVSSSNSNIVIEPKDQQLKNSKLNNKPADGQKKKIRAKNSKTVKDSHSKKKSITLESQYVSTTNLSKNDEIEKGNSDLVGERFMNNKLCKTNKKSSIKSTNKEKLIREEEHNSSSEKPTENKQSSEKSSEVQMELDSFHSLEKSKPSLDNSVYSEKAQEMILGLSMDSNDSSKSEKQKLDVISGMGGNIEKVANHSVNNSNDIDVLTDFENLVTFDENMKNNYLAFCEMKKVLEAIGISIEEVFENPVMINSLNSVPPVSGYTINKGKSDSKISICMHESKRK